jgi:hypothetical protein
VSKKKDRPKEHKVSIRSSQTYKSLLQVLGMYAYDWQVRLAASSPCLRPVHGSCYIPL